MTPGARVAAAIDVLDRILDGMPAEQALTSWARASRFAGAKDRAAIRDHVFDALRSKRSLSARGGAQTGRALMLALLHRDGADLGALFSGDGYAAAKLGVEERVQLDRPLEMSADEANDIPAWLWPHWRESLGPRAEAVAACLQRRAAVFLRVAQKRASRTEAIAQLAADEVTAEPHPLAATCLKVTNNARRVKTSTAYRDGLVELQDAASQLAMLGMQIAPRSRVLDYCAGGGGKALALADMYDALVYAHDIDAQRMRDVPARAARAGVSIKVLSAAQVEQEAPFDVVLCDAPCSGSGTWRRAPDAKWRLTPESLENLQKMQIEILRRAAPLVAKGGVLAYATCSVLECENEAIVARFLDEHREWVSDESVSLLPDDQQDGFFIQKFIQR